MQATRALRHKCAQLLAADTATLAQAATALKIALIMADFAEAESLTAGGVTLATFDGATPLDVGLNAQPEGFDPASDDSLIDLKPPAGGFRFETTGVTNLPQSIYGFALMSNDLATLYAAHRFAAPVVLEVINQRIECEDASLRLQAGSLT